MINKENVMEKHYKIIIDRLESKRNELAQRQKYFINRCNSEIHTQNFERNSINELIVMQQLKSEIEELEYSEMILAFRLETKN
jgi:hypothetical protein